MMDASQPMGVTADLAPPSERSREQLNPAPGEPVARRDFVQALAPFVTPDTRAGVLLFCADYAMFLIGMAMVLWLDNLGLRLLGSVVIGIKMAALYTLAHDALHNNLTASRGLNKFLSVLGYLSGFHNYKLRLYDHLVLGHHASLNGAQVDAYRPMSWQQYRAASPSRKAWERFTRCLHPLAFGPYCIVSRWLQREVVATPSMPAQVRAQAWPHTLLVASYLVALLAGLAWRRDGDHWAFVGDALLAVMLPFFIFQSLTSLILYFQHTHPQIPWFAEGDAAQSRYGVDALTVHIQVPRALSSVTHYILEHPAHHVLPSIPCYRLWDAQRRLYELAPNQSIVVPFSWSLLRDIMRRCQLYDYEQHRWLDFAGRPTARAG